jgi:hypothetical protein
MVWKQLFTFRVFLVECQVQMGSQSAAAAAFGGVLPPGITGTNDRCTLLASNLAPEVKVPLSFIVLSFFSDMLGNSQCCH